MNRASQMEQENNLIYVADESGQPQKRTVDNGHFPSGNECSDAFVGRDTSYRWAGYL
jgi:hypothetical protein